MGNQQIDRATMARAIKRINPVWELREAIRLSGGDISVYRITVETPRSDETWYLKLTPNSAVDRVATEARLLSVLSEIEIPVPGVRGLIDDDPSLPTPVLLIHPMAGDTRSRSDLPAVSDGTLREIASQSGRLIATLHELDFGDEFGYLCPGGTTYDGGVPSPDPASIDIVDPDIDWQAHLHHHIDQLEPSLAKSTFQDHSEQLIEDVRLSIDTLTGPFLPVLARIDQSIENLRLIGDQIIGMLDWEFSLATTPAYDLEHVTWSLAGGPYLYSTVFPDRRELVRDGVWEGYRSANGLATPEQRDTNTLCYQGIIALRSMDLFSSWEHEFGAALSLDRSRLFNDVERLL